MSSSSGTASPPCWEKQQRAKKKKKKKKIIVNMSQKRPHQVECHCLQCLSLLSLWRVLNCSQSAAPSTPGSLPQWAEGHKNPQSTPPQPAACPNHNFSARSCLHFIFRDFRSIQQHPALPDASEQCGGLMAAAWWQHLLIILFSASGWAWQSWTKALH